MKTYFKIPNLLTITLAQTLTSTKPKEIYMGVGILLLHLKYPAILKKLFQKWDHINHVFPIYFFSKMYPLPYTKNKELYNHC